MIIQNQRLLVFGLNEAAVQLMTCKVVNVQKEYVKYYGISFDSVSPTYYPLECQLVELLSYLVGEYSLFKSTITGDSLFYDTLKNIISNKDFNIIAYSIDYILKLEEEIITLNNKLLKIEDKNKKSDNIIKKISDLKEEIKINFLRTQNLIISKSFDSQISKVTNLETLEDTRRKLSNIKSYLGYAEGYVFFEDYYTLKMNELEHIYNILENGGTETALYLSNNKKSSLFLTIVKTIKKLLKINEKVSREEN